MKTFVINLLYKLIDKLENFDISKKKSILILIAIIGVWAGYSAFNELTFPYEDCMSFGKSAEFGFGLCTDYGARLYFMLQYEELHRGNNPLRAVTYELLNLSNNIFGDFRIIPFISSGLFIALTYFIATTLVKRNFAGIVAVLFLLHSPIFYKYDLILTYPNFWATLFYASLFFSYKSWALSPVTIIVSFGAKIINLLNFPAVIAFVLLTDNKNKKKLMITYGVLLSTVIVGVLSSSFIYPPLWHKFYFLFLTQFQFQPVDFLWWLGMWSIELFTDKITLIMIFLLLPCLFLLRKGKVKNASAILAMIVIFILQPAFISGFTEYTNEDYRYLHLVGFVGIGIAFLIPNFKTLISSAEIMFNVKRSKL